MCNSSSRGSSNGGSNTVKLCNTTSFCRSFRGGGKEAISEKSAFIKYEKIYLATSRASSIVVARRRVVAWSQIANRGSIMISSSIFNEFARAPEESTKKQHKQVTFYMRKASQLKVKEKTATIACPAHDRCADRMRRCLTQFRFLMGCQRPLPLPKKKEQNSQKRLFHRSFHLPIERTIDRTIVLQRLIVWSFDQFIFIMRDLWAPRSHSLTWFSRSINVYDKWLCRGDNSTRSSVQLQLHSLPQNVAHT